METPYTHCSHEPAAPSPEQPSRLAAFLPRRLRVMDIVAIVAVFLLVMNSLFAITLTVHRKPWVNRLLGNSGSASRQTVGATTAATASADPHAGSGDDTALVAPLEGVVLPLSWGDLGKKLTDAGVIDRAKFESLYTGRGGLPPDAIAFAFGEGTRGNIRITAENAPFLLNMFWAFGLANKNDVLLKGPMQDPQYGGAGVFSSTGGWTLAQGDAMSHYAKHEFVRLSPKQQELVERVAKGIYRPCCGNSTYFPDCNHGMAMLGMLELMASQGVSEDDLYRAALAVNSYWFPGTYATIAKYFSGRGVAWQSVDPRAALGAEYSSGAGYRKIAAEVTPVKVGGGGCGV